MWVPAIRMSLVMLLLCGVIYPLAVVGVGQVAFSHQANGSLVRYRGRVVGSRLIGQEVRSPDFFWDRVSATVNAAGKPDPYNAMASSGSNLGPTNRVLLQEIHQAWLRLHRDQPSLRAGNVPMNLVTSSGSGLDPDITPAAALVQVPRIRQATGIPGSVLQRLIHSLTRGPALGMFGHSRVNVLALNMAMAAWARRHHITLTP